MPARLVLRKLVDGKLSLVKLSIFFLGKSFKVREASGWHVCVNSLEQA